MATSRNEKRFYLKQMNNEKHSTLLKSQEILFSHICILFSIQTNIIIYFYILQEL